MPQLGEAHQVGIASHVRRDELAERGGDAELHGAGRQRRAVAGCEAGLDLHVEAHVVEVALVLGDDDLDDPRCSRQVEARHEDQLPGGPVGLATFGRAEGGEPIGAHRRFCRCLRGRRLCGCCLLGRRFSRAARLFCLGLRAGCLLLGGRRFGLRACGLFLGGRCGLLRRFESSLGGGNIGLVPLCGRLGDLCGCDGLSGDRCGRVGSRCGRVGCRGRSAGFRVGSRGLSASRLCLGQGVAGVGLGGGSCARGCVHGSHCVAVVILRRTRCRDERKYADQ